MNTLRNRLTRGALLVPACLISGAALAQNSPPATIELIAKVRDFNQWNVDSGHPDFEHWTSPATAGSVSTVLGSDHKPVFGGGHKMTKEWKDKDGKPIAQAVYDNHRRPGDKKGATNNDAAVPFSGAAHFNKWYNDVPGVNLSKTISLTLYRQADGSYLFDSSTQAPWKALGGFFPIDNQLFGNSQANNAHNFNFTTEIHATFNYSASAAQVFQFTGDDDVFVFINSELVIDLGGMHSAKMQFLDLGRLGLTNSKSYTLDIFHAERHTNASNFRFQTNLILKDASEAPVVNNPGD